MLNRVEENLFKSLFDTNDDVKLKKGDHVKVSLGVYEHHGIYTGDGTVVQRTRDGIDEVSLEEFSEGHCIEVVHHDDRVGKRKDVVRRARSHVGEDGYNLFFNNCEHFANEMVSGDASSEQVESGLGSIPSFVAGHIVGSGFKNNFIPTPDFSSALIGACVATVSPFGAAVGLVSEKSVKKTLKKAEKGIDKGISEVEELANVGINIVGDIVDGIGSLFK